MKIAIYHGYELAGSGSNEYTRYLAGTYTDAGHEVHIICREPEPEKIPYISEAREWDAGGKSTVLFQRENGSACVLHRLPHASIRPVYVTDKQREGNVKAFSDLTDDELTEYHDLNRRLLFSILTWVKPDLLHANHLVYQPVAAVGACRETGTPLIIYPHGSSIEYTIREDPRYRERALEALKGCTGLISGSREVRNRITGLYPEYAEEILSKTRIVGVGVDTDLFRPVEKKRRPENIGLLMQTGGRGGKREEQTVELQARLADGDIAVRDYWNAYNHSLPDEDLNEKLKTIPWDRNILLFVGALTSGKGLQSLITAMPDILSRHPETNLVIVGAGAYREVLEALVFALAEGDGPLLDTLCGSGFDLDRNDITGPWTDVQAYLEHPGSRERLVHGGKLLKGHVHFTGRLDHPRLKYLFPCADLAVFPSIVPEAYPLVLMESLSNGVIPVVSYFSGFKDGVDELEGLLGKQLTDKMKMPVEPEHRIHGIAAAVSSLLDEDLSGYGPYLRRIAVEQYDWKHRAVQMAEAYSDFCIL